MRDADEYAAPIATRERALEQGTQDENEARLIQRELDALRRARASGTSLKTANPSARTGEGLAPTKPGYEAVIVMDEQPHVEYVRVLTD